MKRLWLFPLALVGLGAAALYADPPRLELPATVRPTGDYAVVRPQTDAVSVVYVGLSGVDPFPSELLRDSTTFVFPVRGLKEGEYKFAAVGAAKTGEQTRTDFVVVVGAGGTVPGPNPPGPAPDPKPGSLFFVVIRPDGAASPEFTRIMSDGAWDALRMGGCQVKDYGYKEACAQLGLCLPAGTTLPVVVTLRVSMDRKTSRVVRQAIPLPTTTQGIAALPQGVPQ